MKIDCVQTYNNRSFTALRIKKNNTNYLSSMPKKVIDKLDDVGEYLADTKYYHLDINKECYISHINGDRLYPPYPVDNAGTSLIIKGRFGASMVSKKLNYQKPSEVQKACDDIKSSDTQIERTAKIVKYLDDYEKNLLKKDTKIVINPTDSMEEKVDKLIDKYGI